MSRARIFFSIRMLFNTRMHTSTHINNTIELVYTRAVNKILSPLDFAAESAFWKYWSYEWLKIRFQSESNDHNREKKKYKYIHNQETNTLWQVRYLNALTESRQCCSLISDNDLVDRFNAVLADVPYSKRDPWIKSWGTHWCNQTHHRIIDIITSATKNLPRRVQ